MFPWLLCLFSMSSTSPLGKTSPLEPSGSKPSGVWWNPVGTLEDVGDFELYQGDILLSDTSDGRLKNAIKMKEYLWEDGVIPYEFGANFSSSEKSMILKAMSVLEEETCVKFKENDEQQTFIRFQKKKNGCYAPVGRLTGRDGPLPVNLQSPECFKEIGIIEHELLHVVGLFHEQSRPDRDEYVNIHWCNIEPFKASNFRRGTEDEMDTFGLPYDFVSIMHYPKWAFSWNGEPTITSKLDSNMTLGQRKHPSEFDFQKVKEMYQCNNKDETNEVQ